MMVSKYDVSDVKLYDEGTHMKNVSLKSGSKKIDNISKCVERTTDLKTLGKINAINECYIDLNIQKLREIDSDSDLQEKYIKSRAKFLEQGLMNVFIVKLHTNEKLEKLDYQYLNTLLGWSRNDIYVMPTLEFDAAISGADKYGIYEDFVKEMLQTKSRMLSKEINVGIMVPSFYARRRIPELFKLYDDVDHRFVAIDFNNRRIDSKPGEVVTTVKLEYPNEEKTFLYGVNVKPWTKGGLSMPALDLHSIHFSFNAIGPAHSKPRAILLPNGWDSMGKVFQPDDYAYHKMNNESVKNAYIEWMSLNYGIAINPNFEDNVNKPAYSYVKRMNFQRANDELSTLSKAIKDSDGDVLKEIIDRMPDGVRKQMHN